MIRLIPRLCAAALAFMPLAASAHVGIGHTHGFVNGFTHPLSGIDHVLAMIAVGLFAAQLGGRALWLVPLSFVSVMGLAGGIGMASVGMPFAEVGIGLSVVVLGLAVALRLSVPTLAAMSLVGLFAVFHGHAHGVEMPQSVSGLAYGVGFICATVLLHAIGIGLGIAISGADEANGRLIVRIGGAAMAVAGAAILVLP